MKAQEVDQALSQQFIAEAQRLVFWHDTAGEFADYIAAGLPDELAVAQDATFEVQIVHGEKPEGM